MQQNHSLRAGGCSHGQQIVVVLRNSLVQYVFCKSVSPAYLKPRHIQPHTEPQIPNPDYTFRPLSCCKE